MVTIYILQLESNKYYVGKSKDKNVRMDNHFTGYGAFWTKKYKSISAFKIIDNCDDFDELKYTLQMMDKYGIKNVRGGPFVRINLTDSEVEFIERIIRSTKDCCYKCGGYGHFVRWCPNKSSV